MTEIFHALSPYLPAHVFDIIMVPMQILLLLFTLYFFFIGFCCLWRHGEKKILTPEKTFAVVVAAHNEAAVIGQLIENLQRLDYPKELYGQYGGDRGEGGRHCLHAHASNEEEQGVCP